MSIVHETELPGVGTRFTFETARRRVVGVIRHHGGRREVFLADEDDPDRVAVSLGLDEEEAHLLADLLGGSEISREAADLAQGVAGLTVDWAEVRSAAAAGSTIGDLEVRSRTGASIVAVLRDGEPHPAPGPRFELAAGDVVMVVGTADGTRAAADLVQGVAP
jgi:TrkA domain protein